MKHRALFSVLVLVIPCLWGSGSQAQNSRKKSASKAAKAQAKVAPQRAKSASDKGKRSLPSRRVVDAPKSFSSAVIQKVQIEGNKKIERDAIEAKMRLKPGETLTAAGVREDIQSLFRTGLFFDVQIYRQDVSGGQTNLIVKVVEKPSIAEISFEGQSELKSEDLLDTSGLKQYEILSLNKLKEAREKIQKSYEDKGFYLAKVESEVTDLSPGETVKVKFLIQENDKVKIGQISFIGNLALKGTELKERLILKEKGFFSFVSNTGQFKQDALDMDTRIVRVQYLNEGFVKAQVNRPQVYVTPDKKSIYITYQVEEGDPFEVGEVDFAGDLLYSKEELAKDLGINKRKMFSYEVLQKDLADLQAKYGDLGYAFANVIPRTVTRDKDKKVDITFEFDKGNKVHFGEITITGNKSTRDKVIRRELKIREGELYHETRKRQSLERIQRLGFFEEVNFKQSTPPDQPDILNLEIVVKERSTGTLQLSAGYGSIQGFALGGSVNQINFRGLGQNLGAGLQLSRDISDYFINFTEPAFNDSEWRVGGDLYQSQSNRNDYRQRKIGAAGRAGYPIGENLIVSGRYKYETTWLEPYFDVVDGVATKTTDETLYPLDTASGVSSSVTGTLEYDTRNDRFSPSKGWFASTSIEYSGLGGELKYTKGSNTLRYFQKLFWEVVWRNNFNYSFIRSNSGKEEPFNELYLLGGPQSLRGYRWLSVGKTKFSQQTFDRVYAQAIATNPSDPARASELASRLAQRPVGGRQQVLFQTELEFPLIREAAIKGVAFFDSGQAEDQIRQDSYFSGAGFGIRWFSPLGPLRFEWGFPLRTTEQSPDSVVFDFMIGSSF